MEKLNEEQIAAALETLNDWEVQDDFITKEYEFDDFKQSLDFVNRVGAIAEAADHHPDIIFGYGYAEVALTTHDAEGLTENDFALAKQIDALP
ncbi:MAG: 4a-hydroxytetrahydrobiopterin dehydratase [Pyrinomonadaceae bacterium]